MQAIVGNSPQSLNQAFSLLKNTYNKKEADYYIYFITETRTRVEKDTSIDRQTHELYQRFFENWDDKKSKLLKKFEVLKNENEHEIKEYNLPSTQINKESLQKYNDENIGKSLKAEKMEILESQNNIMELQKRKAELQSLQTENLMGLDDVMNQNLHIFKSANKQLETAYVYNTKSKMNNFTTGTAVTGLAVGTVAIPVPVTGSVIGGGIGYKIGSWVSGWVNGRIDTQIKKINEQTK